MTHIDIKKVAFARSGQPANQRRDRGVEVQTRPIRISFVVCTGHLSCVHTASAKATPGLEALNVTFGCSAKVPAWRSASIDREHERLG